MIIRFDKFQELTLGDKDFSKELVDVFISQFEDYIVELKKLTLDRDSDKIKFLNHQIKSSVVTLQFHSLVEKQSILLKSISQNEKLENILQVYEKMAQDCKTVIKELKNYYQTL